MKFRDEYLDYFWGEGADKDKDIEANCGLLPEEYQAECAGALDFYADYMADSMSN